MNDAMLILIGLTLGAAVVLIVVTLRRRQEEALARQLFEQSGKDKAQELAALIDQLKTAFSALSREALSSNTDDFLKLATTRLEKQTAEGAQTLDAKKKLIDARLEEMASTLSKLNTLIQTVEKSRAEAQGSLTTQIKETSQATQRLHDTTSKLHAALANPQQRGQWGERMAEDVLRVAGFIEGVNYEKQQVAADGTRPDFTFPLPGDLKLNMDVKFPLANYLKMLEAADDAARSACASQFLRDVRSRVKEVTTRSYIDPAGGTVDYVLVFIPNEQVYAFIYEKDGRLLDDAMRSKVVLCSPMTLYAILAVVRQAVDTFRLEQNSRRILELLGEFRDQWKRYTEVMEKMGQHLENSMKQYQELVGVRARQLDKKLDRIDELRAAGEAPDLPATSKAPP